jgi:hypothetical protein
VLTTPRGGDGTEPMSVTDRPIDHHFAFDAARRMIVPLVISPSPSIGGVASSF